MCPKFPGELRKNDGIFLYGSLQQKPFVFVYEQKVLEIVYGPSCDPEKEIFLDRCSADGVPVMKRRGGGGTVVLAPGMVVTIVVGERSSGDRALDYFNAIHGGMIALFHNRGVNTIEKKGISDLSIGGQKILGSSLYMGTFPRFYYYQSSLMVDSDKEMISYYLKYPPREPDYRDGRNHSDFCTSLKDTGINMDASVVCAMFRSELVKSVVNG